MSYHPPTLHMLCGKIASGKSTLARRLAAAPGTILLTEDDWLNALFPGELSTLGDYVRCSASLRAVIGPHVSELLNAGISVVLDYAASTPGQRAWMRDILDGTQAGHQMHVMDTQDAVCLARLRARNVTRDHPFAVTEAQFQEFSPHFAPPSEAEGFNIILHGAGYDPALDG